MKIGSVRARRFFSGIFLLAALLMLGSGLTVFSPALKGATFITYWLICFLLTGIAAIVALVDVVLIRRELKQKQRDLIESTLAEARSEKTKILAVEK